MALARAAPRAQNPVNLCHILHQAAHFRVDRGEFFDRKIGQRGFERAKALTGILRHHGFGGHIGQSGIDIDKIARLGPLCQPVKAVGQRVGVGARFAQFFARSYRHHRSG